MGTFTVPEVAAVGHFYALISPPGGSLLRAHFQAASCELRQVLPSMATRRFVDVVSSLGIASAIQAWKPRWKAAGLSITRSQQMQSREGMALGNARCKAIHDSRCLAH